MKKLIRLSGPLFIVAVLLFKGCIPGTALAWPVDAPDKATISGPGLKGEIEITDKKILSALSLGAIEDFERGPIAAPKVGEGYQITRYFYDASFDFGRLHYYPRPAGGRGYLFFEDGPDFDGDHTQYNRKWFYATPQGDAAMQRLLANLGALKPTSPPAITDNVPTSPRPEDNLTVTTDNDTTPSFAPEDFLWRVVTLIILGTCAACAMILLRR